MVDIVGSVDDPVVFFLHGTPGSRRLYRPLVEAGAVRGICHVCYARPGYEGSDRDPGRAVIDCAPDVAAIAEALGVESFYVVGESGGGPSALAVGASLQSRVHAVGLACSVAPYTVEGFDWAAGLPPKSIEEDTAAMAGEGPLRIYLKRVFEQIRAIETTEQLLVMLDDLTSPFDLEIYRAGLGEHALSIWQEVARTGFWGWFDDDLAQVKDWGFELDRVGVRVTVWHGDRDRTVPSAHAEWLASHLRNARLHLVPDEGHNSIINHYGAVLDDLLAAPAEG
jgi:pimeloyl-ACP methyl ester carboxylesterase